VADGAVAVVEVLKASAETMDQPVVAASDANPHNCRRALQPLRERHDAGDFETRTQDKRPASVDG
jgi:hypothetical protein